MKIRMLKTVCPDLPLFIKTPPGTVLWCGETYDATENKNGAVCGICDNGQLLGVVANEQMSLL